MKSSSISIEIIEPNGRSNTQTIDTTRKVINIGSNPANEIVLLGLGIAEFHAVLDCRQSVPRYISLAGQAGGAQSLTAGSEVMVGGFRLRLAGTTPANGNRQSSNGSSVTDNRTVQENGNHSIANFEIGESQASKSLSTPTPQASNNNIQVDIGEQVQWVSPEQTATWTLVVTNIGSRTAKFDVRLSGKNKNGNSSEVLPDDEGRIKIEPASFNLNNQSNQAVIIRITPPNKVSIQGGQNTKYVEAGWYHLRATVESPNYPNRDKIEIELRLRIRSRDAFEIDPPRPAKVRLRFNGTQINPEPIVLPVYNFGNGNLPLTIAGSDPVGSTQIQLQSPYTTSRTGQQASPIQTIESQNDSKSKSANAAGAVGVLKIQLPVDTTANIVSEEEKKITASVNALRSYWFGWSPRKTQIQFSISSDDEQLRQQYQPVLVEQHPLIGPGLIIFLFLLLLIGTLTGFRASIYDLQPNPEKGNRYELNEMISLNWKSFMSFRPGKIELHAFPNGFAEVPRVLLEEEVQQQAMTVRAGKPTTYTIIAYSRAIDWLSWIPGYPVISTSSIASPLAAMTPMNSISFVSPISTEPVLAGGPINLQWTGPENVITYVVQTDDSTQQHIVMATPKAGDHLTTGQINDIALKNITYTVLGLIPPLDPLSNTLAITVKQPIPIIEYFRSEPTLRSPGDTVTISWSITGTGISLVLLEGKQVKASDVIQTVLPTFPYEGTKTFELSAIYSGTQPSVSGYATSTAVVEFHPATPTPTLLPVKAPTIKVFKAEPVIVAQGGSITITWDVTLNNSGTPSVTSEVSIFPDIGKVEELKGQLTVPMQTPGPKPYVLKAKVIDPYSTAIATRIAAITVLEPTPIPGAQGRIWLTGDKVAPEGNKVYRVPITSFATVHWEITNNDTLTPKAEIRNQTGATLIGGAESGAVEVQVNRNSEYQLWATNDPNGQLVQIDSIKVNVQVPPTPPSPIQVLVTISDGIGVETPAIIRWIFAPDSLQGVKGFRIYRYDDTLPDQPRTLIANLDPAVSNWQDNQLPTCGKTYEVVAVYETYTEEGQVILKETDSSENSYASPNCPE